MAVDKAPKYDRLCQQGKTYTDGFSYTDEHNNPVLFDDYTARIEIRDTRDAVDGEADDDSVLVSLTTENGMITISGNTVSIRIPSDVTATFPTGTYYWELELISSDDPPYIPYLMQPSKFKVLAEVTLNA